MATLNKRLDDLEKAINPQQSPCRVWTIDEVKGRPGYFEFQGEALTEEEIEKRIGPNDRLIEVMQWPED